MDFKLIICLLVVGACLAAEQAEANCLGQADHLFAIKLEIPPFAKVIEKTLRETYPKRADLPLIDLINSTTRTGKRVSALFDARQLETGTQQCEKFINEVIDLLLEAGCDYGLGDLDELLEDGWGRFLPEATKVIGYVVSCVRVTA